MRTFENIQALAESKATPIIGDRIMTLCREVQGDNGGAVWGFNGVTGKTPTKLPIENNKPTINDASGNEWGLVLNVNNLAQLTGDTIQFSIPSSFDNLAVAMEFFSHFKSIKGITATINIEEGYVITDGFRIQNVDLSFLTIKSEDPVVSVSSSMSLVSNTDLDAGVPRTDKICFLSVRSKMPKWDILVDASADDSIVTALQLDHGSSAIINQGMGVINTSNSVAGTGTNCRVSTDSEMHAYQSNFSGSSGIGVSATVGATVTVAEADMSNCSETGLDVSRGSTAYANNSNVSGSKEGIYARRSTVYAQGVDYSNCTSVGLWAAIGARVESIGATFDGANKDIQIDDGSEITVSQSTKLGLPLNPNNSSGFNDFNQTSNKGIVYNEDFATGNKPYLTANGGGLSVSGGDLVSVPASSYVTVLNLSGQSTLESGSIFGSDLGVRVTIDGIQVLRDTLRNRGENSAGDTISIINIPSCKAESNLLIEAYNRSGDTENIGYKIYYRN